jgi:hypothetical protein
LETELFHFNILKEVKFNSLLQEASLTLKLFNIGSRHAKPIQLQQVADIS